MCATNLWLINASAFTTEFHQFTADRLGVRPASTTTRVLSERVRRSSPVFTLTRRMCDCDTLIGRRDAPPVEGEIGADAWLSWLRDLPAHVPHVSRVGVLRAWSPEEDSAAPSRARGVRIGEVGEDLLRDIRDDDLLTVDYPRTA